jgi:anti-sigma regulatory factor (Ser/Thr protein kinase)
MVWQVMKPLRPHPLAVGQARNFCTRRLSSVLADRDGYDDAVSDAAVIASELVTNAVIAGSSMIELSIGLQDSCVRIEVCDDAAGAVVPAHPEPTDVKGRGLVIVAALAQDWGVQTDHGTKQVWAEVPIPPRHADDSAGPT